ncbi:notchless protein like 1 [Sphaeroforma arctica JP610]|uniref:Notchless protein like 1 n=1 Tax=Sphaeroforma arctica JP610 TaxID=667725 RepID=A0A0L0FRJ8_9EUKA|nr:notchless protein like 1 [Sphaeroforma arctica JP610]KNC78588.1 notchless protein like 1 [Sphaeroforma arctica JP610]|eukprot:XP_014152490.1 notchless protein like 1 [Sphaeroforma arctica JP610]
MATKRSAENEEEEARNVKARRNVVASLKDENGETCGPPLDLPQDITPKLLEALLNQLLEAEEPDRERNPYTFYINDQELVTDVGTHIEKHMEDNGEQIIDITYRPQAVFKVRAVTRCAATIPGHAEAVLQVQFSPDGKRLVSGSGDTTVRFWDIGTNTPQYTCKGHKKWVLCVAWSPDGTRVMSGDNDGKVILWDAATGKRLGENGFKNGHKVGKHVASIAWEPFHANPECNRVATSSKDGTVKVWDTVRHKVLFSLSQHTQSVTSVIWGGEGLIYSASLDRTIKVWRASDGALVRTLEGHAHRINQLCINTAFACRTGPYDHRGYRDPDKVKATKAAQDKYNKLLDSCGGVERLASASDDFTMFLWTPKTDKKPLARLTGHQQLVNSVVFSPDGCTLASASFDKSVKTWDGRTGKFKQTMRGHVAAVYQAAWSADSRLLLSASKDSTIIVWNTKTAKIQEQLPGHADEVFTADWSPDGTKVASGGKDKVMKLWYA